MEKYEHKVVNVLMYDEENMNYYHGVLANIVSAEPNTYTCDLLDGGIHTSIFSWNVQFTTSDLREMNNITLDDTTMKRIAKFNKIQEFNRLDEEIKEKKEKIKELDDLLKDKEKRWNKVRDYIKNIYDIELDDDDDYDYDYEEMD